MSPELLKAVKERIELGYSHDAIKDELRSAGYSEEVLDAVLREAGDPSPIPSAGAQQDAVATAGVLQLPKVSNLVSEAFHFAISRLDLVALLAVPYVVFALLDYTSTSTSPGGDAFVVGAGLFGILAFVTYLFALTMLLFTVVNKEREVSLNESFGWAKQNIMGLIWVFILTFLVVWGGFMLLIIPGIIVSGYVYFSQYVYAVEGKRGLDALMRSRELVYGHWWDVALKILGVTLVLFGMFFAIGIVIGLSTFMIEDQLGELVLILVSHVFSAGATVFGLHIGMTLYRSLAAAKPTSAATAPKGKYRILAFLGLTFPVIMIISAVALSQLNSAIDDSNDAMLKISLSSARSMAEIHYNENNDSYEGVCSEIEFYAQSGKYSDCVDSVDSWSMSVTSEASKQYCVDSAGGVVTGGIDVATGLCQNSEPIGSVGDAKQRANELREEAFQ